MREAVYNLLCAGRSLVYKAKQKNNVERALELGLALLSLVRINLYLF